MAPPATRSKSRLHEISNDKTTVRNTSPIEDDGEDLEGYGYTEPVFTVEAKSKRPRGLHAKKGKAPKSSQKKVNELTENSNTVNLEDFEYLELTLDKEETDDHPLILTSSSTTPKKSQIDQIMRQNRRILRKVHISCLFVSYQRWNGVISTTLLKALMISLTPQHLLRQFAPEIMADGRTLHNALSMLCNWFKNTFKVIDTPIKPQTSLATLITAARRKSGDELTLVSLFASLLRGLGMNCRFLISLQPALIKPFPEVESGHNLAVPKHWCEVYHSVDKKWIPVDCIRAVVNGRLSLEIPKGISVKHRQQHLFIIGFDEKCGKAADLTRRYCSQYYSITSKLRRPDESLLQTILSVAGTTVSSEEEAELSSLVDGESIPTTKSGFQGHARYILESQLHKYDVFWPPEAGIVGEFRGENVRLRSVVHRVRSKEAWYTQFGRVIKDGELPAKLVKMPQRPTKPSKKSSWEEGLDPSTTDFGQAPEVRYQQLYGEWQTVPFSPPIAVDGTVPKNKYGNVDLFFPSMLPIGCVWIDDNEAWKAAKDLGVDYAAACVRFAFSGYFAVPNMQGIVVCQEYEKIVRRRLEEIKQEECLENESRKKPSKKKQKQEKILQIMTAIDSSGPAEDESPSTLHGKIVSKMRDPAKDVMDMNNLFD